MEQVVSKSDARVSKFHIPMNYTVLSLPADFSGDTI